MYVDLRHTLFESLNWLPDDLDFDLNLLTSGNNTLSNEQNIEIFKSVFDFIKNTKRFLMT